MAILHHALGDHQEAKKYYERALSLQLSQRFPDDVYVANTYHNMETLLYAMGNQQQAKELYERTLSIRLNKLGFDHVVVASTYPQHGHSTAIWFW